MLFQEGIERLASAVNLRGLAGLLIIVALLLGLHRGSHYSVVLNSYRHEQYHDNDG